MEKGIFSGLEDLGFNDIQNIDLYERKSYIKEDIVQTENENKTDEGIYLYNKEVICPVCKSRLSVRAVKSTAYKVKGHESDLYVRYETINPYFYDVWLCNSCGYAAMKTDFEDIRKSQIEKIKNNISPKWKKREYPLIYDASIAIERYKLALLNYVITESKSSKKAMCCLKLAWMYREIKDTDNERIFREQAAIGFEDAYMNEDFPIYGMNVYTIMYLTGELYRTLGSNDKALKYFSNVVVSQACEKRIKDMALEQRDLIRNTMNTEDKPEKNIIKSEQKKSSSFISKLWGGR
ncbi:MAG: DUF2225 domain-containing protein [Clostridia bacterium]|nr:DUF2225 domain-containing protein [Clostridia bacterium]